VSMIGYAIFRACGPVSGVSRETSQDRLSYWSRRSYPFVGTQTRSLPQETAGHVADTDSLLSRAFACPFPANVLPIESAC